MRWQAPDGTVYEECVTFYRIKDEYGELSNMSSAFRLRVGETWVPSSEALYQACRYPDHPDWQKDILAQNSPMAAKMKARKSDRIDHTRTDWHDVNVSIMRWVLHVKLVQHAQRIGALLRSTRDKAIVEQSHKDKFWGAVEDEEGVLAGQNQLGQLLMEMRELAFRKDNDSLGRVKPLAIQNFVLLGEPIDEVRPR